MREKASLRTRAGIGIVACACVVAVTFVMGCGTTKPPATAPTGPINPPPSSTPAAPNSDRSIPIVLTGDGTSETQTFTLVKGLAVFTLIYSGGGNMQASLLDDAGSTVSQLFNVNASTNGSTALGVGNSRYSISVTGTGPWDIQIRQNVGVTPQFLPLDLSGTGPLVTPFFQSNGGNATVTMSYSGSAPFSVTLLTAGGETVSQLANQPSGPFTGSQPVLLRAGVVYLIDVEGVGPWTLSVR